MAKPKASETHNAKGERLIGGIPESSWIKDDPASTSQRQWYIQDAALKVVVALIGSGKPVNDSMPELAVQAARRLYDQSAEA